MKTTLPLPPGVRGVCADCKWASPGANLYLVCRSPHVTSTDFNPVTGWVASPVRCSAAREPQGGCGPAGVHFESAT